jgi:hypothetical protein
MLASKGHYTVTFRSLFGDVSIRVRRLLACPCRDKDATKSFPVFDLTAATVAPELVCVTARYAGLAPFGNVAGLLSELLLSAGRRRRARCGTGPCASARRLCNHAPPKTVDPTATQRAKAVFVGVDGGYARMRRRDVAAAARRCRTTRCASSIRCRRPVALARLIRTWPMRRFADRSARNGAYGTGAGRDAGASSRRCAAGCSVLVCAG